MQGGDIGDRDLNPYLSETKLTLSPLSCHRLQPWLKKVDDRKTGAMGVSLAFTVDSRGPRASAPSQGCVLELALLQGLRSWPVRSLPGLCSSAFAVSWRCVRTDCWALRPEFLILRWEAVRGMCISKPCSHWQGPRSPAQGSVCPGAVPTQSLEVGIANADAWAQAPSYRIRPLHRAPGVSSGHQRLRTVMRRIFKPSLIPRKTWPSIPPRCE